MNALSDEYLFRLLMEGGPALGKSPLMGAWRRTLSEQQIRDLVAFLRALATEPKLSVIVRQTPIAAPTGVRVNCILRNPTIASFRIFAHVFRNHTFVNLLVVILRPVQ
jgi:hypothetical protein